jgi:sugar phosphate isomerase/epimerase
MERDGVIGSEQLTAGMVKATSSLPSGRPLSLGGLREWTQALIPFRDAGFRAAEIHSGWLSFPDFNSSDTSKLKSAAKSASLTIPSVAIARKSVIEPGLGESNLNFTLRGLEVASELGARVVCIGFHPELTEAQKDAQFFWEEQGRVDLTDHGTWSTAVSRTQEIGQRAKELGLALSLEIYEDTLLGSAESALKFLSDVGMSHVGLNPDIGNLLRLDRPIANWKELLEATLPFTNYWHLKNYSRLETETGAATSPTTLEHGVIDYAEALEMAEGFGFDGILVCEQYSDDWLEVLTENRIYLEGLLARSSRQGRNGGDS